uniref:G-protein coupled receptors family 3 profile domain-containing protein n=1 Tax=Xenopus tropicalis TaxID=8364 RepID=A0A1B8Y7Y0_XENTR
MSEYLGGGAPVQVCARLKVLLLVLMFQVLPSAVEMLRPSSGSQLSSIIRMNHFSDGDLIIGGILQINDRFHHFLWATLCTQHYCHLLVFIYTIGEINKDPEILPNVTLGYRIYDSCGSGMKSFASAFGILSGTEQIIPNYSCWNNRKVVGFIGDLSSESSLSIAWLVGIYRYPQISYGSADPIFNNRLEFPSFYRMAPNELSEIDAIMSLIRHFGWKWVGLVVSDDDTGNRASERLQNQMNKDGGCLAFLIRLKKLSDLTRSQVNITDIYRSIAQTMYKTTAKVIILFISSQYIDNFNRLFGGYKMPKKIWIASSSFSRVIELRYSQTPVTLNGTLSLSLQQGEIPGFKQFFYSVNPFKHRDDTLFSKIWEMFFSCSFSDLAPGKTTEVSLPKCTGNKTFDETVLESYGTFNYRIAYGVYTAVYTMAHTLHELYGTMTRSPKSAESLHMYFKQWQLNALMQHVAFRTSSGDQIYFKDNRDPPANYDILKWYFFGKGNIQTIKVGSFDTSRSDGDQLFINNSADLWGPYFSECVQSQCSKPCKPGFRKAKIKGAPSCCYTCVLCADGEMSNITDAQSCTKCSKYEKSNRGRTSCIPRDINYLSYDDHLGSTLSSISVTFSISCAVILGIFIKYRETPIVRANNRYLSCLLLISLMLCFLCTLLFIGRPTQICCLLRQVTFGIVFTISVSSVLAKTLTVIIAFNATKPGSKLKKYVGTQLATILVIVCSLGESIISIVWLASNPPFSETDFFSDPYNIILQCNEGSGSFFFCIIGYIGTLALLSFIAAFLAKDFPDRFNEAKNITFSMLGFCSVWGAFVPAYLSSKGSSMVAVEIFAILSSSAGLLACIFIPKCYIIFLRPELNTKANRII